MCGIAGYNAAPAWVTAHIDEDKMFSVLEEAWLHNQHRGTDAAGYFRLDKENLQHYVRKAPSPASDILRDNKAKAKLSPSLVFAAHTRAATLGDPRNNDNNHPIEFGDVLVTHNGAISNHEQFRKLLPRKEQKKLGEVDSTAIAIALSYIKDPYKIDEITETLSDLQGGLAIHAVWKAHPGVSLLARGRNNPMFIRYHPDGFFAYASVDEALYAMIAAMGMDPNDEAWETRKLDEYTAVVIENGIPVEWGSYKKNGWAFNNRNKMDHEVIMMTPKGASYRTDSSSFWASDARARSKRAAKKANRTKLIFTAEQGFREEKMSKEVKLPLESSVQPYDKVFEADKVYENEKDGILYVMMGDVELVLDKTNSKLLGAFNHSKYPELERFVEVDKDRVSDHQRTWNEWLVHATTRVIKPVESPTEPAYLRKTKNPSMGSPLQLVGASSPGQKPTPHEHTKDGSTNTSRVYDPEIIDIGMEVNWEDMGTWKEHEHAPMQFLNNMQCPDHGHMMYSEHPNPYECERTTLAAIAFASCVTDVSLWHVLDKTIEVIHRPPRAATGNDLSCDREGGKHCTWEPYLWRQVWIGTNQAGEDQAVEVLMGEMCSVCGNKMFIRELPAYMEAWTKDKVYVT